MPHQNPGAPSDAAGTREVASAGSRTPGGPTAWRPGIGTGARERIVGGRVPPLPTCRSVLSAASGWLSLWRVVLCGFEEADRRVCARRGGCIGLGLVALSLWTPIIKGHGIPETLEAIVVRESRIRPRVLIAKPLSAAIAMGTGGPFGAEGPIIVTGGCVGSLLGQILRVSPAERRILLATGAAAGMAGVFATPIAAIVLAFELLLFERSLRALLPLVLACGVATEIHYLMIGAQPLFYADGIVTVPGFQLPLFAALGVAAGILAVLLNKGLFACESLFRRSPIPQRWQPVFGAVCFALIGLAVPGSLSVGYWAITDAVNGRFLLGAAVVLLVAKLGSWWIALASNTSGGTLAPMFLIGATMGESIGIGFAHLFPALHIQPAAFALVAMGATFGAAARALLTGGVFALEVTGAYHLAVPMLICLGIAEVITGAFLQERIMTDKLVQRGLRIEFDTQIDPFRTAVAGQAMDPLPDEPLEPGLPTVASSSNLHDALTLFLTTTAHSVVVVDDATPVGVLARATIIGVLARRTAEDLPQPPTLHPFGTPRRHRRTWRIRRIDQTHHGDTPAATGPPAGSA